MKTLIVVVLFSFVGSKTYSQVESSTYNSSDNRGIIVAESILNLTQLNNQSASIIGFKLNWALLNKYEIGIKINYLGNKIITPSDFRFYPNSAELQLMYVGIEPGYKFSFSETISIYSSFFVGYGYTNYSHVSGTFYGKYFWMIEPNIGLGYRPVDWVEIKLGTNYRYAFNINEIHYGTYSTGWDPSEFEVPIDLNSINVEVGLRFQISKF